MQEGSCKQKAYAYCSSSLAVLVVTKVMLSQRHTGTLSISATVVPSAL